jgi:hypothetical protein
MRKESKRGVSEDSKRKSKHHMKKFTHYHSSSNSRPSKHKQVNFRPDLIELNGQGKGLVLSNIDKNRKQSI